MKFFQGCLNGIMLAIPLWALIILVMWMLTRCELIEKNVFTRLVMILLNKLRGWWYVGQWNDKARRKRRAEFIGSIRLKNLMKGR